MSAEQTLLLIVALVAANLPFASRRIFFLFKPKSDRKAWFWHLFELIVLYFAVGALAYLLEKKLGTVQMQKWEFYAVTAALFLVLAYPGYIWRFLWRR